MKKLIISSLLFMMLALPAAVWGASPADEALHRLFDQEWEYTMRDDPVFASELGDLRYNRQWRDLTLAAYTRRHAHTLEVLGRLAAIDRGTLSPDNQLNYDLFKRNYESDAEGDRFRGFLAPLTQQNGIQLADEETGQLRFEKASDYEDWIARMQAFPTFMQQTIALMREGIKERRVEPKVIMQRVVPQIEHQIVTRPEDSGFYRPFEKFSSNVPVTEQARLQAAARDAVMKAVVPSYVEFTKFFVHEYLPACYDQVGIWQWPDGQRYYEYLARYHTTTNLTPQQIHEIGMREVARIHGEMEKLAGGRPLPEYFAQLRTDPRYFYHSADELLEAYRAIAKRNDPQLVKLFKTLPRCPYGVKPVPTAAAPSAPTAYYEGPAADGSRAGYFFVNLYKPETRPKWEMTALSLHESVPGHHLQIARAMELGDIPQFRRYGSYTAYIEGWAFYCEGLGDLMGVYDDPDTKFGQLTYDMWRSVRLVVDTGMHSMHWTREQSIQFFMDNAPKTRNDVESEIDRYIGWPGQALAYKIGQMKIRELRDRAKAALGDRFDIREFHDEVLGAGALPLDVLDKRIDAWIASHH
jgi:uncharacterized protein (DUF885 family)